MENEYIINGKKIIFKDGEDIIFSKAIKCKDCNGTGYIEKCDVCNGEGTYSWIHVRPDSGLDHFLQKRVERYIAIGLGEEYAISSVNKEIIGALDLFITNNGDKNGMA